MGSSPTFHTKRTPATGEKWLAGGSGQLAQRTAGRLQLAAWSKEGNTKDGWQGAALRQAQGGRAERTGLRVERDEAVLDGEADEAGGVVGF